MRSPALAIGWELWGRNRAGIAVVLAGVLAFAVAGRLLSVNVEPHRTHGDALFIWNVILFAVAYLYLISITLYGEIRQGSILSGFPARMFTLPARTSLLVLWPMLYGIAALLLLWFAMALSFWLPAGAEVQWWVLPLLVVSLAWFQAVCWAVPGSPWAKIIVACIVFPAMKFALELLALAVGWFGQHPMPLNRQSLLEGRVLTLTIFCGVTLPLAYAVAVWGVARDRRGAYQGHGWLARLFDALSWLPNRRERFGSASRAQLWFEWRKKGIILPLFAICFLIFATLAVAPFVSAAGHLVLVIVLICLLPLVAFLAGYLLGKTGVWGGELSLTSMHATRPLSSSALATAKLHSAALSALATLGVLFVVIPLWLLLFGSFGEIVERLTLLLQPFSTLQLFALAGLVFVGLFALTWGQLVGGLTLSLTGRVWVVNAAVAFYLVLVSAGITIVPWVYGWPDDFEPILTTVTWCAATLAGMKVLAAGWAIAATHRRGLLEWHHLGFALGVWLLGACCLVSLVVWLVPTQGLPIPASLGPSVNRVSAHLIALAAVLALPLVRLTAAPLAFAWNRVR